MMIRIDEPDTIMIGGNTNEHGYAANYEYTVGYTRNYLTEEEIQNNVVDEIQQLMDVEVKKVRVKVTPFEASSRREKASRPRVV